MKIRDTALFLIAFLTAANLAYAATPLDRGKVLFYADVYEGYDNNVNLDSARKKDVFTEVDVQVGYRHPFCDDFRGSVNYYLESMSYYNITDASFYDNSIALDLAKDFFNKKATLDFKNSFGNSYYPDEEKSTYTYNDSQLSVRQNFNGGLYHKLAYDFLFREYNDRKAGAGDGGQRGADQKDARNSVTYELGKLFSKKVLVKVTNQYFINDSNDQFMDYYDYWSYRFRASAIVPVISQRLYALVSAGYQRFDYNSRKLVNDNTKTERDDLYSFSSSLVFDITKRTSMSLNYIYRQNHSNEPSEKYSGSIISAGLHYAF